MSTAQEPAGKPDDFVSHLRFVHFTLVVVSVGLVVAVSQPADAEYDEAIKDLRQITSVASAGLSDQMKQHADNLTKGPASSDAGFPSPLYTPIFTYSGGVLAKIPPPAPYYFPRPIRTKFPGLGQRDEPKLAVTGSILPAGRNRIESVSEFRNVWEFFSEQKQSLIIPDKIDPARVSTVTDASVLGRSFPTQVYADAPKQRSLAAWDLTTNPVQREAASAPENDLWTAAFDPLKPIMYHGASAADAADPKKTRVFIQARDTVNLNVTKETPLPGIAEIMGLDVSPDGSMLASYTMREDDDFSVELWSLPQLTSIKSIKNTEPHLEPKSASILSEFKAIVVCIHARHERSRSACEIAEAREGERSYRH